MLMFLQFWQEAPDREVIEDIETALSHLGIGETKAAAAMKLNASQWKKQRDGCGHVSVYRLARLGVAFPGFWPEFLGIRAKRFGYVVLKESELTAALLQVLSLARKAGALPEGRKVSRSVSHPQKGPDKGAKHA